MRFSIRDLFWLATVVAIVLTWWLTSADNQYTITSSRGQTILQDNETMHRWVRYDNTWLQTTW